MIVPDVGDLCEFWGEQGIYLGTLDVSVHSIVVKGTEVQVIYDAPDEVMLRHSFLRFTSKPPDDIEAKHVVIVGLFIDEQLRTLARIMHHPRVVYDDNLRVISRVLSSSD